MPNRNKEPYAVDPRKLASGRWKGRVVRYDATTGKRHEINKTFETKRDAKNWAEAEAAKYREDPNRKPASEETVSQYLDWWFPQVAAQRALRPSSEVRYKTDIAHIKRLIGDRRLSTLTPLDFQTVYTRLLAEGKAPATARHIRVIIHGAFSDAVAWGVLPHDPSLGAKAPKAPRRELQIPTLEESHKLLVAARSERLYPLWVFMALTGVRRGEALALRWTDVDWEGKVVLIQRTQSSHGRKRSENPPKTQAGRRAVALSAYLMEVLRKHKDDQELERQAAGTRWQEGGWVFTTRNGTWFAGGHVYDNFKRLVARAGLPDSMRLHDLRHAMASYWLAKGKSPKVVSERLGHANISITLQIYGHLLPNLQADAADEMDALLLDPHSPRAADGPQKPSNTP